SHQRRMQFIPQCCKICPAPVYLGRQNHLARSGVTTDVNFRTLEPKLGRQPNRLAGPIGEQLRRVPCIHTGTHDNLPLAAIKVYIIVYTLQRLPQTLSRAVAIIRPVSPARLSPNRAYATTNNHGACGKSVNRGKSGSDCYLRDESGSDCYLCSSCGAMVNEVLRR